MALSEHASDCELHNAPAKAPGNCSCGASRLFRLFRYDIVNDVFGWVTFSREALIADVVSGELARAYGRQTLVRASTLIERAVRCGFTPAERAHIAHAWSEIRIAATRRGDKHGHLTWVSELDGRHLSLEDIPGVLTMPADDEIADALALWFDWWRTLPEPGEGKLTLAA